MSKPSIKHLLTGDELSKKEILDLLALANKIKLRQFNCATSLVGKQIALSFEKPSLRTRFSFSAAINKLGADVIESVSQNRKSEEPKDFIQVVQGYCDAIMIRTFDDNTLTEMKAHASIPIINGLTNDFHPCQSLADLMTLKGCFGSLDGLKMAYIGDGNNVLHSLLLMATKLGVTVHYCCPVGHQPKERVMDMISNKQLVKAYANPVDAVKDCHAVYTDVWTSMGFDDVQEDNFSGYQVSKVLMSHAHKKAVFMHCMPMNRGQEVSDELPDDACSVIFKQSENRMHVQQALLYTLLNEDKS